MSARSAAGMVAALLAILTATPLALAGLDTADPPTGKYNQTEGPRYWISLIDVRYAQDHPLQPPIDLVREGEYALGRASDGFVGARRGGENYWFALEQLGADGPVPVYATGLRDLCEQIVGELGNRGLIGVFVAPEATQIDPETGSDLRAEGDTELVLIVHTGRVRAVRTFAAENGADPGAGIASVQDPDLEEIAARSPLQPVGAGDPLAKNELDAYVASLNRHPGRIVDVVITPTLTPGIVNLDYIVEEDRPWMLASSYSDTGTSATGHGRQRFSYANYQLSGRDDVLLVDYVTHNFDDVNALLGSYEANLPFLSLPFANSLRGRLTGTWSQYAADEFGQNDAFQGDQWDAGAALVANLFRNRDTFVDASLGARWMNIEVENFEVFDASMPFFVPELALTLERLRPASRMLGRVAFEQSLPFIAGTDSDDIEEFSDATRSDLDDDWRVLSLDLRGTFFPRALLRPAPVRRVRGLRPRDLVHEIAWRFGGQYSLGERLIPQVEGVLGGTGTVRGYPQSIVSGDSLLGGSVEYRFHIPLALRTAVPWNLPLVGEFRPAPDASYRMPDWDFVVATFFDYGQVWNAHRVPGEEDATLTALGVGFEVVVRRNFSLRLDYGIALSEVKSADVEAGDGETHFAATVRY